MDTKYCKCGEEILDIKKPDEPVLNKEHNISDFEF